MKEILKKIAEVQNEHPYKVVGDRNSYSQYNEGWSDACVRLEQVLSSKPVTIGDKIRESNGKLANALHEIADCKKCPVQYGCKIDNDYACYGRIFNFLNQPYKE